MIVNVSIKFDKESKNMLSIVVCYTDKRQHVYEFENKYEYWSFIEGLYEKYSRYNSNLYIYGYKGMFDLMQMVDFNDPQVTLFNNNPLIVEKKKKVKNKRGNVTKCMFLNLESFFGLPLKSVFNKLGYEYPKWDYDNVLILKAQNVSLAKNLNDLTINFRKMFIKEGFRSKGMVSIGQVAISTILKMIRRNESINLRAIFNSEYFNKFVKPSERVMLEQLKGARGGRFEALMNGNFEDITQIDLNSAYSWADTNIRFPDLNTLVEVNEPLQIYNMNEFVEGIISKIGMTKLVMNKVNDTNFGIVPVRFEGELVFPNNSRQLIIGTYTHQEINFFLKNGYEIVKVFKSIYYEDEIKNPLKEIIPRIYELRKKSDLHNMIFKRILNYFTGKLIQKRINREIKFINRFELPKWEYDGWKPIDYTDTMYLIEKKGKGIVFANWFCAQVYSDITAKIRLEITNKMNLFEREDVIYASCDGLLIRNFDKYKDRLSLSDKMGDFKIEGNYKLVTIIGKQQYRVDDKIKASGVKDASKQIENFKKGVLKTTKTIALTQNARKFGQVVTEVWDLNKTMDKSKETQEKISVQKLFIDDLVKKDVEVNEWVFSNVNLMNELLDN